MPLNIPEYLKKRLSLFSNIALACIFQNRFAKSLKVRVVTTHLHWDPEYSDIKLLQASILVEWLESNDTTLPTVIAGDFNSKPGEPVIDYLIRGKVFPSKMQSLLCGEEVTMTNPVGIEGNSPFVFDSSAKGAEEAKSHMNTFAIQRQGVKLASAYNGRELPFTNKTPEFEGVIDHILYSSGTLSVRDVLGDVYIPSKVGSELLNSCSSTLVGGSLDLTDDSFFSPDSIESFKQPEMTSFLSGISSLPSCHFPSDHISLCAWLKWKTVPILSNLARPTPASSRRNNGSGSTNLSQSVPSESIWKQNGSKVKNTPRKSSLCSSVVVEEVRTNNVSVDRNLFDEQKSKNFGRSKK